MSHRHCNYTVLMTRHENWFSYGADLVGDIRGPDTEEFYRRVLSINNKINGAHIAFENTRLVLIRDDFFEDLDKYNLYRSLDVFHDVHEFVYKEIL